MKKSNSGYLVLAATFSISTLLAGSGSAFAGESPQPTFSAIQGAETALQKARETREALTGAKKDLDDKRDALDKKNFASCPQGDAGTYRPECDQLENLRMANFHERAEANLALRNAIEQEKGIMARIKDAKDQLARAPISAENANAPEVNRLRELQKQFLESERDLQAYKDELSSKSPLMAFFSRMKDKAGENRARELKEKVEIRREAYLAYLEALTLSVGVLVETPSSAVATAKDATLPTATERRSPCLDTGDSGVVMAGLKVFAANFVNDVKTLPHQMRCGPGVASTQGWKAPIEDRSAGLIRPAPQPPLPPVPDGSASVQSGS